MLLSVESSSSKVVVLRAKPLSSHHNAGDGRTEEAVIPMERVAGESAVERVASGTVEHSHAPVRGAPRILEGLVRSRQVRCASHVAASSAMRWDRCTERWQQHSDDGLQIHVYSGTVANQTLEPRTPTMNLSRITTVRVQDHDGAP